LTSTIHILGFTGSLRKKSYNRATLHTAQGLVPPEAELEIAELGELPLFNQDFENDKPEVVHTFEEKIRKADALLIVTPEFNYSVPGVLKNAIDWVSWPYAKSVITGKPTAILGAGGRVGTARAQLHLRQMLQYLDVPVLNKPEVFIQYAWEKFDPDGNLIDETTRDQIKGLLEALVKFTRRFSQ
jgi:chromate reductase, NAD(P)H dehydrogenase (quinone)